MFLGSSDAIHLGEQTVSVVGTLHPVAGSVSGWGRYLGGLLGLLGFAGVAGVTRRSGETELRLQDEERLRREVTAYLTLDLCPRRLSPQDFGRMLCRTVATRSSFARAALLFRDETGRLVVTGSAGVDDLTVKALDRWGATIAGTPGLLDACDRVGTSSLLLHLERRAGRPEARAHALNCATMHLVPMRTSTGLIGALAVCATTRPSVRGALSAQRLHSLLEPLEALALTLTLQLGQTARPFATESVARPRLARPQADRSPVHRSGRSRRRADHSGAPVLGSSSHISLQQLASIAAAATALPATGPAGVMVGFPAIDHDHALPAIAHLARQASDPGARLFVAPAPHLWAETPLAPGRIALAPPSGLPVGR